MTYKTKSIAQTAAHALGLPTHGTKAEIQDRINAHLDSLEVAAGGTYTAAYGDTANMDPVPPAPLPNYLPAAAAIGLGLGAVIHFAG
jgi:hypothetical protein